MIFHVLQRGSSLILLWVICWLPVADVRAAEARKGSGSRTNQATAGDGKAAATPNSQTQGSQASPILSVVFDDPNLLFSAYPEGISLSDVQNNPEIQKQDVATGVGASAKVEIGGGDWAEGSGEPPKSFVLLPNPEEGIKSALRIIGNKVVPGTSGIVRITPQGVETSMASLSSFKDGKVFLNGGIDMFFRYSEEPPAQSNLMPYIFSSQGPGLHFVLHAHEESVIAFLNDSEGKQIFDTDLDGTADAERVDTASVNFAQFDPEKFQHLAVWFQTGEDGTVTMKVFFKAGTGSINTGEDADLVSTVSFRIITGESTKLLEPGSVTIAANSRSTPEVVHNDIAAFRLFAPAPVVFPGLAGDM